ncbi:MAG: MFS transporter [Saprospiraceae bacterium]|nr:MAG: MFS transporter [Saprospiraceae bacterium]
MKSILTRTVVILGFISFFTDMASEMLYPIMPLFLQSIGFSVVGIGLLEGLAEATAGLSKGWFGKWSDSSGRRVPFVQAGYLMSALAKPLMAVWLAPLWVFFTRTIERLGKGVRTGARDAILSAEATPATKARVFGFHRGMDTFGAAVGPALGLLYLAFFPGAYRALFFFAIVPGLFAVAATLFLKEKKPPAAKAARALPRFSGFYNYLSQSTQAYRRLLFGLLAFALANSSDFFLLLLLKERGLSDSQLIGTYIFYNLVYALAAYPAGSIADRWGLKKTFLSGVFLFAAVYAGMAFASQWWHFGVLFFAYGLYAASTEGIAKAWLSNIAAPGETATAIGTYEGFRSLAALLASALAGLVWYQFGPQTLFLATAALTGTVGLYFLFVKAGD